MSTISAYFIGRPYKQRICDHYRCDQEIGPHIRMYGSVEGDPPYIRRICLDCAEKSLDAVVRAALAAAGKDAK